MNRDRIAGSPSGIHRRAPERLVVTGIISLLLAVLLAEPATAAGEGWFGARRVLGLAFLGGSAVLVKQGFDFKDEADSFYDRYKVATDAAEIDRLYQRTNNRDVKSQVSWALGGAFAVSGLRLLIARPPGAERARAAVSFKVRPGPERNPVVALEGQILPGRLALRLKHAF
ncbi:MAG: hypothetical protein WDA75_18020 [Candidatus Latescibacterota bacterium]|jgi:hypothetical protein